MRITTPVLLASLATLAAVTKISLDTFFPNRARLSWKLLTAPAVVMSVTPAASSAQQIEWTPLTLTTESGEVTDAERAVISVPERHANPSGPQVKLPMIRFRTKAAKPRAPVIYLAGGPGNSGLAAATRDQYFPGLMAFRELSDVIVFDQRGTGGAEPSLRLDNRFDAPLDVSITSPQARESLAATAAAAARSIRDKEIDISAYNTAENADDIESIRTALGADKVALWGHSYGSHLGLAYIKRHGDHVERAIFGGVNGLDDRWRLPSEGQAWLESIDAATKKDARLRAVMPDFIGTTKRVFEKLESNPLRVTVDGKEVFIGAEELRTMLVLQGGESDFVKQLPLIIAGLDAGNGARFAGPVNAVLRKRPLGTAMIYSMHIASGVSSSRLARIERETPKAILRNAINFPWSDEPFRQAWGVTDLGDSFRTPVKSSVPTLFLSGTIDGRTSVSAAREARKGFSNGKLVVLNGAAHDIYAETPALMNIMTRFMRGEQVRDTTVDIPVEFHSPDEPAIVAELRTVVTGEGVAAAIARAEQMRKPGSGKNLTSYVMVSLAGSLNTDKRPEDAIAVLEGATRIFPDNPVLFSRLGSALLAAGNKAGAASAFKTAVGMNPFFRYSAVQAAKLGTQ